MPRWIKFNLFGITWAILIAVLSLTPLEHMPEYELWLDYGTDEFFHAFFYAALVLINIVGFSKQTQYSRLRLYPLRNSLAIAFVFGLVIEILQTIFVPLRGFEWLDLVANGVGCLLGWFAFYILYKY